MSATGTIGVRGPAPIASAQPPQSRAVAPPTVVAVTTSAVLRRYAPVEHHSHGVGTRTARPGSVMWFPGRQPCAASRAAILADSSAGVHAVSRMPSRTASMRRWSGPLAAPCQVAVIVHSGCWAVSRSMSGAGRSGWDAHTWVASS